MRKTNEEKGLLTKLASGVLDGMVGDEKVYRGYKNVYCGKYIKDGEPVSYRQGESERFFNGKENERIPGKREEEHYDTDEKNNKYSRPPASADDREYLFVFIHRWWLRS